MDSTNLLPANATAFEVELAHLSGYLSEIDPTVVETIWDAWRCPARLLPWLAWALSVDVWEDDWSEIVKRQAIADSPYYHRIKGTKRAVLSALSLSSRPATITEWFQRFPIGRRGTATVFIECPLAEVPAVTKSVKPFVLASKPKSRAVVFYIGEQIVGEFVVAAGVLSEEETTIDPISYAGENVDMSLFIGIGVLAEEDTTIEAV